MRRWSLLLASLALAGTLGCARLGIGGGGTDDATAIAEMVLRVGEGVGTEVETLAGALPAGLDAALNPGSGDAKGDRATLPVPPESRLRGSGRVGKPDGSLTFFVMYEVSRDEGTVADAMRRLLDESPWQLTGGRSSEGVSAFQFQSTRSDTVTGTMIVQPLPTTGSFELVVSRGGKQSTLTVRRHAFVPALGAELEDRDAGLFVARVVPGEAASSGLKEGDRIVKAAGKDVRDRAGLQSALRGLREGKSQQSGLVYIMQVAPETPIQSRVADPEPRAIPPGFPATYLLLDGMTPISTRWMTGPQGAQYEVTLLSRQSPAEVLQGYRQALRRANAQISSDRRQGASAVVEFTAADGRSGGGLNIEPFDEDPDYTSVTVQVQSGRGGAAGGPPSGGPPAGATGPASTPPASPPTAPPNSSPAPRG